MPGSSVLHFIFLLIPLTLPQRCGAANSITASDLQSRNCSSPANLSSGGGIIYEMNLRQFLATLPSNVIKNRGSFNGSVGATNAVFGMAMCQADMPWPDHCESCLQAATAEALKACPSSYNASVAYRGCGLQYWDTPVRADALADFLIEPAGYNFTEANQLIHAADTTFNQTLFDLFKDLSSKILTSPLMIASDNRKFNSTHHLYGLAQCYTDLPMETCSSLIFKYANVSSSPDVEGWPEELSITWYEFYIRYDLTPFDVYLQDNSSGPTETAKDVVIKYKDCPSSGNVSTSSNAYQLNLHKFLDALPSNAIKSSGFYNDSTTGSENKVFGTAMCQADIAWPGQCKNCLQAASAGAPKACPASNSASVAYQGCVLRYSDVPILAAADDEDSKGIAFYTQNHAASVANTTAFQQTRQGLLTDLAGAAVNSPMMIGSSNREFNSTHKLYGLAQCNKDLPKELCSGYIQSVTQKLAPNAQWSEGVSFTGFNVYVRYDLTYFAIYVPPSQEQTDKGGFVRRVEIIVILVVITMLGLLVLSIRYYKRKERKNLEMAGLRYIRYGDIKRATNYFDKEHLIGEGGFGKVYKGKFKIIVNKNITEVDLAIKCVRDPLAAKQLKNELKALAKAQHRNVVSLVGFCNNDGWFRRDRGLYVCSKLIINGPLDNQIFASSVQPVIEWRVRYEIMRGICAGLQYLHEDLDDSILHMDLKPSNILLDEKMKPKIADFGLSRTFWNAKTHTYTKNVIGTNGYIAPEFLERGRVGRACDIYSLGVLMLAIVMGDQPRAQRDPGGVMFINKVRDKFIIDLRATTPNRICSARDREQLKKDASLQNGDCIDDVEKCIGLAFQCVNEIPEDRPTATDICTRLNQAIA